MDGSPPLSLLVPEGAELKSCGKAMPVAMNYWEEVRQQLEQDVQLGMIERVGVNMPTTWLSKMIILTCD